MFFYILPAKASEKLVYGVPQGSVLGPILYVMYVNSICHTQIATYADDTCLLFSHRTWEVVHIKATLKLKTVLHQLTSKLLSLNIKKTQYDFLYKYRFLSNGFKSKSTRYQSVTIDEHLRSIMDIT